ncbi:Mitochondrial metalloendopeptidase OMA1 [Ananas comosus]|uniref:Mitochondrial metalloendopeptidase OMA1 n=1 Tax=Ananas comosus TaxID=4615 RepID=A0A199VRI6_ANACO|nr:Mitochondrial metalloendopeptidase OMA1 [Ananas comosus]
MNFFNRARTPLSSLLLRRRGTNPGNPRPPPSSSSSSSSSCYSPLSSLLHRVPSSSSSSSSVLLRRNYFVARSPEVVHFRRRSAPRWYHNPRNVVVVVVLVGGAAVSIYYGHLETVPYTKRRHFVLLSPAVERQLGESQFTQLKSALRDKILPALHPDSVRVRLISADIIRAVELGLRRHHHHHQRPWTDIDYASHDPTLPPPGDAAGDTILLLHGPRRGEGVAVAGDSWRREDEVLDDSWVLETRKKGEARGSQPDTRHLERLNWEVLVVKDNMVNAFCLPGGKIVVFTGLLDHFREDAEIATVIGHEVGHAIARHSAEMITKNLWFAILQLILLQFIFMPDVINAMSTLLLRLPFSRRMEMEADYIGLMLLAAAGYDPRIAPKVYEKLGKIVGDSNLNNYLSTHPSSKKRAELLSQAKVMEEAMLIYRETLGGRGIEGFL